MSIVSLLILVLIGAGTSSRKGHGVVTLLDLIEDYCGTYETLCSDDLIDELIGYLSGQPYDDDVDAGTSRTTLLLESIDDRCGNDKTCVESLVEILKERILDGLE